MMSKEEAQRVLTAAVEAAKQGVDGAEASLIGGSLGVTRFADNEVHQSTQRDRELLSVRVVSGGRAARSETSDLTLQGLRNVARQARVMAELLPEPKHPIDLPGPQSYAAVESFDPDTERASPLDRMALAGRAIIRAHKDKLDASGYVATRYGPTDLGYDGDGPYAIANSRGLFCYHAGTRATMSVTMHKKEGLSGWSESESFALAALDASRLSERAAGKALVGGEPRNLKPGRYTVVLEPAAVAALLQFLAQSVGAEDVATGRSFLSGRLGSRVAKEEITILDDHTHPLHRGVPFDVEGIVRRKVTIIEEGVAQGPVRSLDSALRYGGDPTGHKATSALFGDVEVASHLVMQGGRQRLDELVSGTPAGILVTRFWYVRMVEPRSLLLTGVTRDGTFLIEGGEIVAPVANMRFNVSLLDLLNHVQAMGEPVWAGGVVVPPLRASEFFFSSPVPS
jgi:predicted Zn-dependent protease